MIFSGIKNIKTTILIYYYILLMLIIIFFWKIREEVEFFYEDSL